MKRTLVRALVVAFIAATLFAAVPLASAGAAPVQWAQPNASVPDWAIPDSGLHPTTLAPLAHDGPMTNLTNSGRLATEEMAWYGVWMFPGQTLDLRLASSSDCLLVLIGQPGDTELAIADSVGVGTESITLNYTDTAFGPQFMWIGVGAWRAGSYTLRASMTDPPVGPALARVSGADRYATSVKASQDAFADGAETVILATGANFPDALAAAGLCGACDAPLLLVPTTGLPSEVSAEIDRLGATRAIIIGGSSAVSPAVQNALAAKPALTDNVIRIAGNDRFLTARLVAEAMQTELGTPLTDAIVVCGTSFPDALSASPLSYAANRPILLTSTSAAHSTLLGAMEAVGVQDVTIIGGASAVSAAAESQIEAALGTQAERWAGPTRYDTSCIVAEKSVATGALSREFIGYASGLGFPDGLAGGIASARRGGALVLTQPYVEPAAVQTYNLASAGVTTAARVYGGPTAVWGSVLGMIHDDLGLLPGTYVYLDSDPGDYIGGGREYSYTPIDASINVGSSGGHLSVSISGGQYWYGDFAVPDTLPILTEGSYLGVTRYPFHDPAVGGMSWYGEGRGSNELTGWFAIDDVTYSHGELTSIHLRFEQHSEGSAPALHGTVHWTAGS